MSQSRKMSAVESMTNVVVGLAVSAVANAVVLPFFGMHPTWSDAFNIAAALTALSFVRSYGLRRVFEFIRERTS